MTSWEPFVPVVTAILGAVVGGVVVHRLTLKRESLSARRSQKVSFLPDAYRKLIDASEHEVLSPTRRDNLESAFADIMLMGGAPEIEATQRFQLDFVEGKSVSLIPVIEALCNSLRNELGLSEVKLPQRFNLRLHLNEDPRTENPADKRA